MTGFLHHLAGMVLGEKPAGAAQASLPPRFSTPPPTRLADREVSIDEAGPSATPGGRMPGTGDPVSRAAAFVPAVTGRIEPEKPQERVTMIRHQTDADMSRPAPLPTVADVAITVRADSPGETQNTDSVRKTSMRVSPRAMAQLAAAERPLNEGHLHMPTRAAPLSPAAFAARTENAGREQRPVVHVTIDRIDVRTASVPRAGVEQRRPRPKATVSLSDYLRAGARGERE